jgi:small GTP-binding protein
MPTLNDLIKKFPEPTQSMITQIWAAVPEEKREILEEYLQDIPLNKNMLAILTDLAINHSKRVFGNHRKIAIIGPANVGKSTLYNHFIRNDNDKAAVSPIPGTTRINQEADAGLFTMVDTPGADAVGPVGVQEREHALEAAHSADFLIILFDAMQGVKQTEQDLYHEILTLKKPFIIALNKIDQAGKHKEAVIERTAINLGVEVSQIIPISALKGKGIEKLLLAIVAADPEITIALGSNLPLYRRKIAWRTIATSSSLSGVIALAPLPVIDFIPLIVNQVGLVISIARIYKYKITKERAQELVGTFGIGMLGRTLFQQLSKLGSVPGWLLSSAIATSMTVVMGYAAIEWFEKGERITSERFNQLSKDLSKAFMERFKQVFKKRPSKKSMRETIENLVSEQEIDPSREETTLTKNENTAFEE